MKKIKNKNFSGNINTINIYEDCIIENCSFINCRINNDDILKIWNSSTNVLIKNCIFDQSNIDPYSYDEAISLLLGPTVIFENCVFKNIGKTILCGNGDYSEEDEKTLNVKFINCLFDGCSRRNPYFRYGKLLIENCKFYNWGRTFHTKSHAIRISNNCDAEIKNCYFHMDKIIQTNLKNFIIDWFHQISRETFGETAKEKISNLQIIKSIILNPIKFLSYCLPGACKGISIENTAKCKKNNCSKNKWWIKI